MPDLTRLPGEQERLLLVAALGDAPAARVAWLQVAPTLDIDVVAHETHGVFGQLAENLRSMQLEPQILPRLDGVRKRMWATNARRVRHVMRARAVLEASGVRVEAAGGLAVLLRLGDPAVRPLVDAELVVDREEVAPAQHALESAGWRAGARRSDGWLLDLRSATFVTPDEPRGVTLRWSSGRWPYATGDEDLVDVPTGGQVRAPSRGRLLAWTLIEGYHLWGYNPTRRYADAMLLAHDAGPADWDEVLRLTAERRASTVVGPALKALDCVLATPVPRPVLSAMAVHEPRRRSTVADRAAERSGTVAAFLRRSQGLTAGQAVASAPAFLQDVWDLDHRRDLPAAAVRRLRQRRRRRAGEQT